MKIETEDLTKTLKEHDEQFLIGNISNKFDKFNDDRNSQLTDLKLIRNAIYNTQVPKMNAWDNRIELPDIYELAQTLKSHISQNLYSHPDAMFDVSGTTPQTQSMANRQKAMLVNTFEQMKLEEEMENEGKTVELITIDCEPKSPFGFNSCEREATKYSDCENREPGDDYYKCCYLELDYNYKGEKYMQKNVFL